MKISELTNKQLGKIFEKNPEWVWKKDPEWCWHNHPEWCWDDSLDIPDDILEIIKEKYKRAIGKDI